MLYRISWHTYIMFALMQELDPTFSGTREYRFLAVSYSDIGRISVQIILFESSNLISKQDSYFEEVIVMKKSFVLWQDIAASVDEEDVAKFTDVVKEFDSMTPLVCFFKCDTMVPLETYFHSLCFLQLITFSIQCRNDAFLLQCSL